MDTLTYWNGTWHEGNPAILGPRDHAFWLGSMVFDGGRAFEGCGPDLDLHAERVVRSARSLGLKPTKTAAEILTLMHEGVRRFGPKAELKAQVQAWADAQSWTSFALTFALPSILLAMLGVAIMLDRRGRLDQPFWAMSPSELLVATIALTIGVLLTGAMKRGFSSSVFVNYL